MARRTKRPPITRTLLTPVLHRASQPAPRCSCRRRFGDFAVRHWPCSYGQLFLRAHACGAEGLYGAQILSATYTLVIHQITV